MSDPLTKLKVTPKGQKMITLTFETWEDFDNAIPGIVKLETAIASDPTNKEN